MKPDVVVVFSFGSEGVAPNYRLIRKAEVFGRMGIPIFTQRDLPIGEGIFAEDVLKAQDGFDGDPTTIDIVRAFEHIAWKARWRKVLVLAAPQHMQRCLRDMRRALMHPDVGIVMPYRWKLHWKWYDQYSAQWYTRGPLRWWVREAMLRALPWAVYYNVTASCKTKSSISGFV
jgi:hypothetical protein